MSLHGHKILKISLSTINKLAGGTVQERRYFDVLCEKAHQHSVFLQQVWKNTTYRLVEIEHGRLGIYREGIGGYIVDPSDTLFFPDEVMAIYERL